MTCTTDGLFGIYGHDLLLVIEAQHPKVLRWLGRMAEAGRTTDEDLVRWASLSGIFDWMRQGSDSLGVEVGRRTLHHWAKHPGSTDRWPHEVLPASYGRGPVDLPVWDWLYSNESEDAYRKRAKLELEAHIERQKAVQQEMAYQRPERKAKRQEVAYRLRSVEWFAQYQIGDLSKHEIVKRSMEEAPDADVADPFNSRRQVVYRELDRVAEILDFPLRQGT